MNPDPTTVSRTERDPVATTVIGLTGAPAAGKSAAAAALAAAGCEVVDADALGHAVLEGSEARAEIVAAFGRAVDGPDGLDRAALARIAFADATALRRLEAIVHPRVRGEIARRVAAARRAGVRAVVLDAALLFETGLAAECDVTICVDAPAGTRSARARSERGWVAGELERREARQLSAAEKRSRADHVIVNTSDVAALRSRVLELLDEVAPAAPRADHP